GAARLASPPRPQQDNVSLEFAQPPEIPFRRSAENNDFAISPDGRTIAFIGGSGSTTAVFLRRLDTFAFRKLEGSDGANAPFWSSGGDWIGYTAGNKLWKSKVAGGAPPEAICDVNPAGARASWVGNTILLSEMR